MIITKTPFRISFFGGGTDMAKFYDKYGGSVISTTIDKYCYVNVRHLPPFFEHKNQVTYSKIERVKNVDEIEHPMVREAMKYLDMKELIVTYDADLPARTGLGTSSSFAVGMLNACYALKGKYVDKKQLADDAIYIERVLCNEDGGLQDQIAASFGGLNRIDFTAEGYTVSPIIISQKRKQELNDRLMLFYTGCVRFSSDIQKDTKNHIEENVSKLIEMKALVDEAQDILTDKNRNLDDFGKLLDYTWKLKRQIGKKISTETIDSLYDKAMQAGALGGKLLGAGGGGFLLFYVPEEKQDNVKKELSDLLLVPFKFDNAGTQIIYYAPEEYELTKGE